MSFQELNDFAIKNNLPYMEVSALTGKNVYILFENLTKSMVKQESDKSDKKPKKCSEPEIETHESKPEPQKASFILNDPQCLGISSDVIYPESITEMKFSKIVCSNEGIIETTSENNLPENMTN